MAYSRPLDDIRVGGEIDAVCTRCKLLTGHRIVAMVEGGVKRVMCLSCQGEHNYRQPAGAKKEGPVKTMRIAKDKKMSTSQEGLRVFDVWVEKKAALESSGTPAAPYSLKDLYSVGQALDHPKFGLGFVQKIIPPNKIEIMFQTELKVLAMNMQ